MAGLLWNQWQLSCGTGGSFAVESVAGFTWNQWQLWRGIRTQELESALKVIKITERAYLLLAGFYERKSEIRKLQEEHCA